MVAWGGEVIFEVGWSIWGDCLRYGNSSVLSEMVCSLPSSSVPETSISKTWSAWNFQLKELEFILEAITEVICSIPSPLLLSFLLAEILNCFSLLFFSIWIQHSSWECSLLRLFYFEDKSLSCILGENSTSGCCLNWERREKKEFRSVILY